MTAKTIAGDKKRKLVQRKFTISIRFDKLDKCLICNTTGVAMFTCKLCGALICFTCLVRDDKTCPNCSREKVVFT